MHCFFCNKLGVSGENAVLDSRDHKHLFRTLRAKAGDRVELTDGVGAIAVAEVTTDMNLQIVECQTFEPPKRKVHLFVAPPKKNKMDFLLKQCSEVGVWSITPMITERSVSNPEKKNILERWRTLLLEGCKQSKNPFLPEIVMPVPFESAVESALDIKACCLFGSPRNKTVDIKTCKENENIAWFVGPEGGFTESEEAYMLSNGFNTIKIGQWVLRVETAAICGAALLNS